MKHTLFKVFRFGEMIAIVKAFHPSEAISKAIEAWGKKKFRKIGARSSEDAKELDRFLNAVFTTRETV